MSWKSVLSTSSPLSLAQTGIVLHRIQAVEVNPIHNYDYKCNLAQFVIIPLNFAKKLWCIAINALHKNKSHTKFGTIQLIAAQSVTQKYHH
jgi:hypothetical protein